MSPSIEIGVVTRSEETAPGVGLLAFEAPGIAREYRPGHFVHLVTGDGATILRRPFSVARVRGPEVILVYRIVGTGTEWMRSRRPGDPVDAMGPLGHPFEPRPAAARTLLVGGGLGIAPLLGLAESLRASGYGGEVEALLGVRSRGDVFSPALREGIEWLDWQLATDDGSDGFHGNVVEFLETRLEESSDGLAIYAAGPEPMLEGTARVCMPRGFDLQVSMEAHMACGVGACRACGIVTWRDESRINGRVCREGPVFDAKEILWEATA